MAEEVKKPKSKARKIIEWILFGIFGLVGGFILVANISSMIHKKDNYGQSIRFGMGTFVVLTTSMEPDIGKDTMIVTFKEDVSKFEERLKNNETIDVTFMNVKIDTDYVPDNTKYKDRIVTDTVMTHRLREIHVNEDVEYGKGRYILIASGINTKGDYSLEGQYQIFTEAQYLGTVKISSSFLGGFMSFISSPIGLIVVLLIPAGYLIVVSGMDIFKALKENEEESGDKTESNKAGGDHLSNISDKDRERLKNELLEEMMKAKKEGKKNDWRKTSSDKTSI